MAVGVSEPAVSATVLQVERGGPELAVSCANSSNGWHLGWRRPMRLMLIVVTVAVAMFVDVRVSQATQMPWCAGTNTGRSFSYNCTLPTYEMCVQEVIAGNRGFCSPNPYYRGPEFVPPRAKRKRYYY